MNHTTANAKRRLTVISLCGVFAALTAVGAQITVAGPGGVNFTLQTFIIAIFSFCLDTPDALKTVLAYIALGAIGLPVFNGFAGGAGTLAGPTGGFIAGFTVYSLLCSIKINRKPRALWAILFGVLGTLLCHICGAAWYCVYKGSMTFWGAVTLVSLPFLPKDILLTAAAYFLSLPTRKMILKILPENNKKSEERKTP